MRTTIPTVKLFGLPISKLNMKDTLATLVKGIEEGATQHVVTINPIMMMEGLEKQSFLRMLKEANMLVPDGTGVVWAAKHIGEPVAERVPGIELMHELLRVADQRGWRVFLLGASPDSVRIAREKLAKQFPGADFVGHRDGFFGPEQDQEVVAAIRELKPHLLFVGRAMDNQDMWIHQYRKQLNIPLMMGVGGSIDVVSGRVKRAPLAWQKLHLEWFYRLVKQPFRYKRMLPLPIFVWKVLRGHENSKVL